MKKHYRLHEYRPSRNISLAFYCGLAKGKYEYELSLSWKINGPDTRWKSGQDSLIIFTFPWYYIEACVLMISFFWNLKANVLPILYVH